jgi:hypothetical protein
MARAVLPYRWDLTAGVGVLIIVSAEIDKVFLRRRKQKAGAEARQRNEKKP